MSIPAQVKYIILTLLFVVATVNFVRTTLNIIQSSKRLEDLKDEVSQMENQKAGLEADLAYKQTDAFIEEQARNALNLIKPGEKVYVAPKVLGKSVERDPKYSIPVEKTNLELWAELFF